MRWIPNSYYIKRKELQMSEMNQKYQALFTPWRIGNVAKQIYTASNETVETYEYKIFYRPNNPLNENMLIDA